MHIKISTTRTKDKTYRYVRVAQGDQCEILCTIGLLEDVIASRETLIKGLQALTLQDDTKTTGQKKRRHGPTSTRGISRGPHRTKKGRSKSGSPVAPAQKLSTKTRNSSNPGKNQHRTKKRKQLNLASSGQKSKYRTKKDRVRINRSTGQTEVTYAKPIRYGGGFAITGEYYPTKNI